MKTSYCVFFLLWVSQFCQAQEISFSQAEQRSLYISTDYLLDVDDTGYYIVGYNSDDGKKGMAINHLNSKLNKTASTLIEIPEAHKYGGSFFSIGKRFFYSYSNRDQRTIKYAYQEFDRVSGKHIGQSIPIGSGDLDPKDEEPKFRHIQSEQKNYTAFFTRPKSTLLYPNAYGGGYDESYRFNPFNLTVVNKDLETVWTKSENLEFPNQRANIKDELIDDQGNLYLLVEVEDEDWKKKRKKGIPYSSLKVIVYQKQGTEKKIYHLDSGDQFFVEALFSINEKGQVICVATQNDIAYYRIEELSYFVIDLKSEKPLVESIATFSKEQLDNFKLSRKNKKQYISFNYDAENLLPTSDGGAYLCMEYVDGNLSNSEATKYAEIVVIRISPEGKIEWTRKIEKNRTCTDIFQYCSYSAFLIQDQLHLLYNIDNASKSDILLSAIDLSGKVSHQNLTKKHGLKMNYIFDDLRKINPKEVLFSIQFLKKGQYGRLKF